MTSKVSSPSEPGVKMEKSIGLLSCISIIIGSVIGSGIFVSPTGIIRSVNSIGASLIIWVVCGIFSTLGAYCYAELGTMSNRSGGDYYYFLDAFGPFWAFLRLWVEVIVARPATLAVIALTFSKYVLKPIYPDCTEPELPSRFMAACCLSRFFL
ncbi:unnamed protein product [Protopolystoma xenopodis]|uniref:Amino acid permease/ SLC12A domain-containing protein n=1 Tax=Protopolystoma xenopodis TaxID=117903 RepID=A0A448X1V0_9PLAT|nr:unnamed protein product [Protopolystoma xenopodis]